MQQLTAELAESRGNLQHAREKLVRAQQEVDGLQTVLLQQSAVAEAAQAQAAAAELMQSMQQGLADSEGATITPDLAAAAAPAVQVGNSLAALMPAKAMGAVSISSPGGLESLQSVASSDPKMQRIQELRAALAAALSDAAHATAPLPLGGHYSSSRQQSGQATDAKLQRIQELTVALTAAAGASGASNGLSMQSLQGTMAAAGAAAEQDAKVQRIHELRAALANALQERDELKLLLAAADGAQQHRGVAAGGHLEVAKQPVADQVGLCCRTQQACLCAAQLCLVNAN